MQATDASAVDWKSIVAERLSLYGHRNWIVVADSAYPAQTRAGIETVVSGADHLDVLRYVLGEINHSKHVRATLFLDSELSLVEEKDAPGIERYRKELDKALGKANATPKAHEQIIKDLDQAGETFKILLIKTNMTIPYTSVFLRLDCGYWSDDAEKRLRQQLASH